MNDCMYFFFSILTSLFNFLGSAEIFSGGLTILDFIVCFVILLIIVDNFIIKPAKGSGFHIKTSLRSKKGGK